MKWTAYVEIEHPVRNEDVDRISSALRDMQGVQRVNADYNGVRSPSDKLNRVYHCIAEFETDSTPEAAFDMTQNRMGQVSGVKHIETYPSFKS